MRMIQNRRTFMTGLSSATIASAIGTPPLHAEPPPETGTVRLTVFSGTSDCQLAEFIATELLQAEGFTDVRFLAKGSGPDSSDWMEHGEIDFDWNYPARYIVMHDKGVPITILAGLHAGCLELFANGRVRGIPDPKGKRVGIDGPSFNTHLLLMIMAGYVGLDPHRDIEWVTVPDALDAFAKGHIDAFLATPPQNEMARERKLGHVILDTSRDHPWSQYYCCTLAGARDYVTRNPVATKRVMRALLKAVDLCVSDPERVARLSVEQKFAFRYDFALKALKDLRFGVWRDYDTADTMRFFTLRMQEAGMTTSSPQQMIADYTDFRFINELKRELKA